MTPLALAALLMLAAPAKGGGKPDAGADVEEPPPCAVEASVLKPQFARRLPPRFTRLSSKREKQKFTDELKLPDGSTVTAEIGGCEHLRYAFLIKSAGLTTRTVGAELVAIARRVLPQLPMDRSAIADPALLLRAIEEASIVAVPSPLPCGDATCELSVIPEPPKEKPPEKEKPGKRKGADKKKPDKKPELDKVKPPPLSGPTVATEAPDGPGLLVLSYDFPL